MSLKIIISSLFLLVCFSGNLAALDSDEYIHFPSEETVAGEVFFFWRGSGVLSESAKPVFKLSLFSAEGERIFEKNVSPSVNGDYLEFSLPDRLAVGNYRYTINCFRNSKESSERFSGSNRYPVKGGFSVASVSDLPQRFSAFPQWYAERHINTIENGYNSLFFLSSGTACGAFAYLFFTVLDFNIFTRIIGYAFAASAVTGYGASAYYCYRYFSVKDDIDAKYNLSRGITQDQFRFSFNHSW